MHSEALSRAEQRLHAQLQVVTVVKVLVTIRLLADEYTIVVIIEVFKWFLHVNEKAEAH